MTNILWSPVAKVANDAICNNNTKSRAAFKSESGNRLWLKLMTALLSLYNYVNVNIVVMNITASL